MDYNEFDSFKSRDAEYVEEDDEEFGTPARRAHVTLKLSWQQIAFIIGINAILSLIISLVVVIIAGRGVSSWPGAPVSPEAALSQTEPAPVAEVGGETSQAQPPPSNVVVSPTRATVPTTQPAAGEVLPTETPVEPTVYIVQAGDTLTSIARKFDVSLEDLMLANGITDPDYVLLGQELLIPIGGLPQVTPTFTPVPVPTDTPLPFNPPTPLPSGATPPPEPAATVGPTPTAVPTLTSASVGEIRLVLQVLSPGDLASEMVQVVNQGPFVRLAGWTLSDEDGNVYTFPDFSLWGGGAVNVHTASGSNTTTDLYWGQSNVIWDADEVATLKDAGGTVIATYMVPAP